MRQPRQGGSKLLTAFFARNKRHGAFTLAAPLGTIRHPHEAQEGPTVALRDPARSLFEDRHRHDGPRVLGVRDADLCPRCAVDGPRDAEYHCGGRGLLSGACADAVTATSEKSRATAVIRNPSGVRAFRTGRYSWLGCRSTTACWWRRFAGRIPWRRGPFAYSCRSRLNRFLLRSEPIPHRCPCRHSWPTWKGGIL